MWPDGRSGSELPQWRFTRFILGGRPPVVNRVHALLPINPPSDFRPQPAAKFWLLNPVPMGTKGTGSSRQLVLFGRDGHFAVISHPSALGAHPRIVCQRCVDDAPVGGGHWLQGDAAAGLNHPAGDLGSHVLQ